MSIQVSWAGQSKTAIVREFEGAWTWEEFYKSQDDVNEMLRSVDYPVHQILDFSKSRSLPANALTHIRNSGRNVPANRGKSIVVSTNAFYQQMYHLLDRLFPSVTQRVVLVATREAALKEAGAVEPEV